MNGADFQDKPTVQIINPHFWQTKKGLSFLAASLALIIFVILLILLNYLDILLLPFGFLPQKLIISCPIKNADCGKNQTITLNNYPAIGYKVASSSSIVTPIKIVDTKQFASSPFRKEDPIGLYQSFILGDNCYTITYTVPYDSDIAKITKLPLNSGTSIINLGSESIQISSQSLNLILQIQKRPVNQNAKTDAQKCHVYNIDPKNFGTFEQIQSNIFR